MPHLPSQAPGEHPPPATTGRSAISPIRLVAIGCLVCFLLGIGCVAAFGIFVDSNTNGKFVRLTYAGTFENGAGTITVVMKGSPEGRSGYQVHSFNIASPLFDQKSACPGCSYPCDPGTRFCPKCGAAMDAEESAATAEDPE